MRIDNQQMAKAQRLVRRLTDFGFDRVTFKTEARPNQMVLALEGFTEGVHYHCSYVARDQAGVARGLDWLTDAVDQEEPVARARRRALRAVRAQVT
jgi:hypothetical protein